MNNKILNIKVKHFSNKIDSENEYGLQGSGLLITNPPWGLEEKLKGICEYVEKVSAGLD